MDSSPNLATLWDYLNTHAAVTVPVSSLLSVLLDRYFLRRKTNAEAMSAEADGLEKRVRVATTVIDLYREATDDTRTGAASKIRDLKRELRDVKKELADMRGKYDLLLALRPVPGLTGKDEST